MRIYSKLIVAAFTATALLALAVSSAVANHLSVNEKNFEFIWNTGLTGKTKLHFIARTDRVNVGCNVTLLGHFTNNTIAKNGTNQGTINHGELESCENGTAIIKGETMPWPIRYRSFSGTLPRIRSISTGLIGATFKVTEGGGLACEFRTEANHPGVSIIGSTTRRAETGLESIGEPENITAEEEARIPLAGELLCSFAGEVEFEGLGLIRNLPRAAKLRIQLI